VTFGEWWSRAQQAVLSSGAGKAGEIGAIQEGSHPHNHSSQGCLSTGVLRRRLVDLSSSCGVGRIYCWMQCQTLPEDFDCTTEEAICASTQTNMVCPELGGQLHDASCKATCPNENNFVLSVYGSGEGVTDGVYRIDLSDGERATYLQVPSNDTMTPRMQIRWDEGRRRWELFSDAYRNSSILYLSYGAANVPPTAGWEIYSGNFPSPSIRYTGKSWSWSGRRRRRGNELDEEEPEETFCNGVITDMHMGGFVTHNAENIPCLVFFSGSLVLDEAAKFWLAIAGTVLIGITSELFIAMRRWRWTSAMTSKEQSTRCRRRLHKAELLCLYASTRFLGYGAMLLTMTYSVEFFMAVIVGMTIGHALFNMDGPTGEDATPCCTADMGGPSLTPPKNVSVASSADEAASMWSGEPAAPAAAGHERQARFQVSGMTCENCLSKLRSTVTALPHVRSIPVLELESGLLVVELAADPDLPASAAAAGICQAIETLSYQARPLQ